jgi:hypothetical protein
VGEASMERGEPAGQGEKAVELTEQPGGDEAARRCISTTATTDGLQWSGRVPTGPRDRGGGEASAN